MPKSKTPSFEDAMQELEMILEKMADEDTTLDESIALYAKAAELIQNCSETLNNAKKQVDAIGVKLEELTDANTL